MTLVLVFLHLMGWFLLAPPAGQPPTDNLVALQLWLRDDTGAPVSGAIVQLQRFPEDEPTLPDCRSDAQGQCAWRVPPGLYQVRFDRPLDPVSAAAVAEGGLEGLGLTVGERDITYHFVFPADNHVYFDAAPAAAIPAPIIPAWDDLYHDALPTATPSPSTTPVIAPTIMPTIPLPATDTTRPTTPDSPWRLLLFIGLGVALGSGLHYRSRRRAPSTSSDTEADPDK